MIHKCFKVEFLAEDMKQYKEEMGLSEETSEEEDNEIVAEHLHIRIREEYPLKSVNFIREVKYVQR